MYVSRQWYGEPQDTYFELLLTATTSGALMTWESLSDRISIARYQSRLRSITIVQCYVPKEISDRGEKCFGDIVIGMGDLNAKGMRFESIDFVTVTTTVKGL